MRVTGRIFLLLVLALSVFLLFVAFDLKPEPGDEGILTMDAWRISGGEVPHRDFFQFIPPLAAYIQALFFKLLGPSVFSVRLLGLIYGLLLLSLSYYIHGKFISEPLIMALSISFVVIFGVSSWEFGSHHWLCGILQLSALAVLLGAQGKKSLPLSLAGGALLGMAVFALQDQGGYAVAGLALVSFFSPREERRYFLIPAAAAVATFSLLSLPFALAAGPVQLYRDWILFPLFYYKLSHGNQVFLSGVAGKFLSVWDMTMIRQAPDFVIGYALGSSFILLMPVLAPLSLFVAWKKRLLPTREFLLVTVFVAAFLLTSFHRFALSNLLWAFFALFPLHLLLDRLMKSGNKRARIAAAAFSMLVIASCLAYGVSKARFCLDRDRIFTVTGAAGTYRMLDPGSAASMRELLEVIDRNVKQDEPLFCAGYIPLVNFLSARKNPTRLNFVYFGGYYSREQVMTWSETLERKKVPWGVSARETINESNAGVLIPGYRMAFANDRYILWKRK